MIEAPTPEIENNLTFEHKMKIDEKDYIFKINNSNSIMNLIINEINSLSNELYLNSFSLSQLQNLSNYFKMFDTINDTIMNLNKLFEENKYNIMKKDKSIIINFSPGILLKGEIQFILLLKEKSQNEKINDLTLLTYSILKRLGILEKENLDLKSKVKELTEKLNEYKCQNKDNIDEYFKDSVILTSKKDKEKMLNFINKKIKNVELLYRATRDGDLSKNFHEKCDNKGPTLIICKEKVAGNIFGGYTEAEWDSKNKHPKSDKNAFIYSITYNKIFVTKNIDNSIECNPNFGPIFGFGGDLTIFNNCLLSSSNNMWTEQKTYFDKKFEINNGNKKFKLDELEVYLITFKHK